MKHFYIGKLHPLSSPMIVCSLEVKKDPFCLKEDNEEPLGLEVPYYNVISALMYLWWYDNIMEINQANNVNMWTTLH